MSDAMDLASPPPLQDHRFGEMIKGKRYAYARGLTINPMHLPTALDAMEDDGWTLMAIFGETKSDKIGFVFKRTGEVVPSEPKRSEHLIKRDRFRERNLEIWNLREKSGFTLSQIARRFGLTPARVWSICRDVSLRIKNKDPNYV